MICLGFIELAINEAIKLQQKKLQKNKTSPYDFLNVFRELTVQ